MSALIGWLQLDLREDFADLRWIETLTLSWGQFGSAHHLFPAFTSSSPLSPILSVPEVTSEVSGMISCVYFYLLSPIYVVKAIFFPHCVPVIWGSTLFFRFVCDCVGLYNSPVTISESLTPRDNTLFYYHQSSRWVLKGPTLDLWPQVAKTKRLGKAGGCNPLKVHTNLLLTFSHRPSLCFSAWTLYVRGQSQRPIRWWELFVKSSGRIHFDTHWDQMHFV